MEAYISESGWTTVNSSIFTDNLLLFAKATESQVEALFKVLILSAVVRDKRLTRTNLKSCSPKIWKATVRGS